MDDEPLTDIHIMRLIVQHRSLDVGQPHVVPVMQELGDRYTRLASSLLDTQLRTSVQEIRATAESYDMAAAISSLFFVFQIGLIRYMGEPPIPRPAAAALQVFSLLALILTAFGTTFAFVHSKTLKIHARTGDDILKEKARRSVVLLDSLITLGKILTRSTRSKPLDVVSLDKLLATFPGLGMKFRNTLDKLQRLQYIIDHHLGTNYLVLLAIPMGILSEFVSLFIFLIGTTCIVVWVPVVILAPLAVAWFLSRALHHHPDIWKKAPG